MKKIFSFCLVFLLCMGGFSGLWAQDAVAADAAGTAVTGAADDTTAAADPTVAADTKESKGKGQPKGNLDQVEVTGVLQVTPADTSKNQKYPTIVLVSGDKQYKLLPGKDKDSFAKLEKMNGQTITAKGGLMPATEKYPMAAIKVDEYQTAAN